MLKILLINNKQAKLSINLLIHTNPFQKNAVISKYFHGKRYNYTLEPTHYNTDLHVKIVQEKAKKCP